VNNKEFEDYFKSRYQKELNWYNSRAKLNKNIYYFLQFLVIIVAAITPVLAVLQLKWSTVAAASVVAIISGIIRFIKLEEIWINYRTIAETLKKEPYLMKAGLSDYSCVSDKKQLFIDRVESLISRENTTWISTISTKEKK
jgi:hypothetical protein